MLYIVDSGINNFIHLGYGAIKNGQRGLIEESRSNVEEILQALQSRLPSGALMGFRTALGDGSDAIVALARRAVTLSNSMEVNGIQVRDYLVGIRYFAREREYADAHAILGLAVTAAGRVLGAAAEIADIRARVLNTDEARDEAELAREEAETNEDLARMILQSKECVAGNRSA